MPVVSVIEPCYEQLTEMKKDLIAKKKAKGEPAKVTYSEIICSLIRAWKTSNDLAKKPSFEDEKSLIPEREDSLYKSHITIPALETTNEV